MNYRTLSSLLPAMVAPWFLLIAAWRATDHRLRHWLLTFFVTIYGATITIAYDPFGEGPDGVRHLLTVYTHYVGLGFSQFISELWLILTFRAAEGTNVDVYIHILSYITGGVFGEPRLFFPIVAFVYGYFFTGSILEVFKNYRLKKHSYLFFAFAALFFLTRNIEGVNTVRTWTGMWVLVYACLKYYSTRRIRYLLLMLVPPLIHIGFFVIAIPAWLAFLIGNKKGLFAALFVASSFTTFVNPGSVADILSETEVGERQVQGYYVEEVRDSTDEAQRIWLWLYEFGLQKWALNVFIYTLLASGVYFITMNRSQATLFSIGLLTMTLSNATWYLYALSNRSWLVGSVFIFASYLSTMQDPKTASQIPYSSLSYKPGLHISLLLFIPYFAYNLSTLIDFPSVYLLGFPFLAWITPEDNMSIKELMRLLWEMLS